jgi:hypothetical protein
MATSGRNIAATNAIFQNDIRKRNDKKQQEITSNLLKKGEISAII